MCVDYCELNEFTIKNWYPLPLISRLLDQLNHAKVYTKIDLCGAYNLVCIQKGDEWEMTFITHYDHFENIFMQFGLINVLAVFQHLMDDVFYEYLDDFMICYIVNVLIFSKNMEDHEHHLHLVLNKFEKVGLYTKLEKCEFHQFEVNFLGSIIFWCGICVDFHKVQTIVDYVIPMSSLFLDLPTYIDISLPINPQ